MAVAAGSTNLEARVTPALAMATGLASRAGRRRPVAAQVPPEAGLVGQEHPVAAVHAQEWVVRDRVPGRARRARRTAWTGGSTWRAPDRPAFPWRP